jgi:hypothetical protein
MKKMLRIMRNISIGVGVFALVVLLIAIVDISNDPDPAADETEDITQEETAEPELSPEEQRREFVEEQFSAWDGSHRELVRLVKDSMNDPRSFEHIETRYTDNGDTIVLQMRFRGSNAFGALVQNTVIAEADTATGEILSVETAY